jgi:hypothetical protein
MDTITDFQAMCIELEKAAYQLASDVGLSLSDFKLEDGRLVGCVDMHIMSISVRRKTIETIISHKELATFMEYPDSNAIVSKLRSAIDRLHLMLMNS